MVIKHANSKRLNFFCWNKPSEEELKDQSLIKFNWCEFMQRRAARVLQCIGYKLFNSSSIDICWVCMDIRKSSKYRRYCCCYDIFVYWYCNMASWYYNKIFIKRSSMVCTVCTIWCLYMFLPLILTKYQYLMRTGE